MASRRFLRTSSSLDLGKGHLEQVDPEAGEGLDLHVLGHQAGQHEVDHLAQLLVAQLGRDEDLFAVKVPPQDSPLQHAAMRHEDALVDHEVLALVRHQGHVRKPSQLLKPRVVDGVIVLELDLGPGVRRRSGILFFSSILFRSVFFCSSILFIGADTGDPVGQVLIVGAQVLLLAAAQVLEDGVGVLGVLVAGVAVAVRVKLVVADVVGAQLGVVGRLDLVLDGFVLVEGVVALGVGGLDRLPVQVLPPGLGVLVPRTGTGSAEFSVKNLNRKRKRKFWANFVGSKIKQALMFPIFRETKVRPHISGYARY